MVWGEGVRGGSDAEDDEEDGMKVEVEVDVVDREERYVAIEAEIIGVRVSESAICGRAIAIDVDMSGGSNKMPSWARFSQISAVKRLIEVWVEKEVFCLSSVKRAMRSFVGLREGVVVDTLVKPDGNDVRSMFRADMFESGAEELPPGDHSLSAEVATEEHLLVCELCHGQADVSVNCYFSNMRRCLTHGWKPRVDRAAISPPYLVYDNYKSITNFSESANKEFAKMIAHRVVELVPSDTPGLWNPMGAAIKNSDRRKAQALAGITISDNDSLKAASKAMELMGLPAIKARITHDATASGLNGAALCPPFSYPSFANGLQLVTRDCWMAKTDISRYFHAFPLAKECRDLFLLSLEDRTYRAMKCVFGFGPCPYYTSTWSAEYRRWIWRRLVPNAHMMDDWLTVAKTRLLVEGNLACMCAVLEGSGHSIQMEKNEVGQRIVFLGILIDSQRMTVSFEPVQARGMSALLQTYLNKIRCGRTIDGGSVRSVAGSLNWYSEVLQSGRLHVRSWWLYSIHKGKITAAIRRKLITDTQWWVNILDGGVTGQEYLFSQRVNCCRTATGFTWFSRTRRVTTVSGTIMVSSPKPNRGSTLNSGIKIIFFSHLTMGSSRH